MKRLGDVLAYGFVLYMLTLAAYLVAAPAALSEVDRLKAENHVLRVQVLSLQEQLAAAQVKIQAAALDKEQAQLEQSFKTELSPADGSRFNWSTFQFEAAK
jgi:hypothetical protein